MPSLRMPELMIIGMISLGGIVPLVAGVWALVTLYNVRKTQDAMRATLDRVERAISQR